MRLGIHLSAAGGPSRAAEAAARLGLECLQIFSGTPRTWKQKHLAKAEAEVFRQSADAAGLDPVVVHAPYLINLASADYALWRRSYQALASQLKRAARLGAKAVVVHPGSRGAREPAWGLERAAEGTRRALEAAGGGAEVWLENTAGGGGHLGGSLEEMAGLLDRLEGLPAGGAIDTAHAFAAGYPLESAAKARAFLKKLDQVVGLERIKLWHLNDSDFPLGGHRDRHTHLGQGLIGVECFAVLVNHPRLRDVGGVMETPKDTRWADRRNLALLRRLRRRGSV
ncbi:MAG: deoxyribonuclease IV [Desulfarculaceae bacterium]|nr:deoxyribonuclease IV [Desulfarculaceae bacterium]MCF8071444.1 deoxyribonuclease IV [Desulfarculaceae bacterium]MCF8103428.1 deoxyribonuclease IV [Desulfarculaceae bacterium]MCF8117831.1 deoxyribonuclease IV [Desulfarculaceae bacterium]